MNPWLRALLTLAALALAALTALGYAEHRRGREELTLRATATLDPARHEPLAKRLRREPDLDTARIQAARLLLGEAVAPPRGEPLPTREQKQAQLAAARELAGAGLAAHPGSWEAAMTLGAATYLERSFTRDDRLFTAPADWEAPLDRARELAPGHDEPAGFLAMAYLEVWALLPEWKRQEVRRLLVEGLDRPASFDRLISPWLTVAADTDEALSLVPPAAWAWERLLRQYGHRRDWPAYRQVVERWRQALAEEAEAGIAQAEQRLARDDLGGARHALLGAIRALPAERRYAALFARAVVHLPAGPVDSESAAAFGRWLDWSLTLCLLDECPLPPEVIRRLGGALFDLPPPRAALAKLAGGDLTAAESIERRAGTLFQREWGPYLLLKAARLAERGDGDGARQALRPLHPEWSRGPLYWRTELAVARSVGDAQAAETAAARLAALRRSRWQSTAWHGDGARPVLDLMPGYPASGVDIELTELPPDGGVVEVHWDGATVGPFALAGGEAALTVPLPVDGDLHRLEVETLIAAGRVRPGRVALLDRAGG